jgi:exodeoxyribonuclease V alpha subunit
MPLVTAHAALLGRTLLYTAFTRARQLVVLVGQRKALGLAVSDWRRSPRHTALDDILTGALKFSWPSHAHTAQEAPDVDSDWWEGLTAGDTAA